LGLQALRNVLGDEFQDQEWELLLEWASGPLSAPKPVDLLARVQVALLATEVGEECGRVFGPEP
jgi:hypothetical protein